jgi:aryl-alcohol dehydrogenase-like predicted oxidoreductase
MTSCSGLFDFAAVDELKRLAAKYGKSLPQLTLRWTLHNPVVGTALVGFRTPAEIIENLDAVGWDISDADMAEIDAIFDRHGRYYIAAGLAQGLAHRVTIG